MFPGNVYLWVPGIRVKETMGLGDQMPCASPGSYLWKLNDGSVRPWSYLPVFVGGQRVNRFKATILLPTKNLIVYQIGVVTSPQVDCEDPVMVVLNEAVDGDEPTKPQHQCPRVPRYDAFKDNEPQTKTCVFECIIRGRSASEVMVIVQFNRAPWIKTDGFMIYEIEAYTYW